MSYFLVSWGHRGELPLTTGEYTALRDAKVHLETAMSVERNFDIVMENYAELEDTILSQCVRKMLFYDYDTNDLNSVRENISRRILNLLSSAKLYQDALRRCSKSILDNSAYTALCNLLEDGKHQPMEYRMVNALRNYTQHEELPVSSLSISRGWEGDKLPTDRDRNYTTIIPKFDAERVGSSLGGTRRAKKANKSQQDVRAALKKLGSAADIMDHLRKSIEYLGDVHAEFRRLTKKRADQWKQELRAARENYRKQFSPNDLDIVIACRRDGSENKDQVQIFDDYFGSWDFLRRKNHSQKNLSKRYVKWTKATA